VKRTGGPFRSCCEIHRTERLSGRHRRLCLDLGKLWGFEKQRFVSVPSKKL
jgi:hypothetical protein